MKLLDIPFFYESHSINENDEYFTLIESCNYSGLTPHMLYENVMRKKLRIKKVNGEYVILKKDLDAYHDSTKHYGSISGKATIVLDEILESLTEPIFEQKKYFTFYEAASFLDCSEDFLMNLQDSEGIITLIYRGQWIYCKKELEVIKSRKKKKQRNAK